MFSVNGLIIVSVFSFGVGLIVEHIKQEADQQKKARKDIKDLKNIFPTVWKD
tara:strand:- start:912 stop:1067 length:156 start_codon:yes stop_codon:yes gene_type:complete